MTPQPETFGPQGFLRSEEQYVSKTAHYDCKDYADPSIPKPTATSVKGDPERIDCGQAYATYEAPAGLAPSGQEVALLTRSTTGHTGRGGAVAAIVRLNREWQVIDEIGYQDPNVACSRKRVAKWVFVNANPNGSPIYGWFALKRPLAGDSGYRWNVRLASGSPGTRACAARGVPEEAPPPDPPPEPPDTTS